MSRRSLFGAVGAAALAASVAPATASAAPTSGASLVDLTHVLTPGFPVWPGAQQFAMRPVARIGTHAGGSGGPCRTLA
ncbi:hypothetical protein WSS_A10707 [Rhodococcus opacus M213]|uniref:Uncharacterized protein n=1 Tax=Rhodococcus opacus M213 TaxID=1129896 RepID=K8XM28_RHOOP|nr:hypothetical protein WSS_A10707 [Rhodococcus opacus M213]